MANPKPASPNTASWILYPEQETRSSDPWLITLKFNHMYERKASQSGCGW